MRLLITADLHFNHPRSRPLAIDLIDRMNQSGGDGVLLVGDTAIADGEYLEECLSRFTSRGARLFVAGNHELWTRRLDPAASHDLHRADLPRRIHALGWTWLEDEPATFGDCSIVGSVGWYDYRYALQSLEIPRRFYEKKVSPGATIGRLRTELNPGAADVSPYALNLVARWNDGRHVRLGISDAAFVDELLAKLKRHLDDLRAQRQVVAAVHHVPFAELLPHTGRPQLDFARAFLGSPRFGELLLQYPNLTRVYCGHSHFRAEAHAGHIHAINIGSGYREKRFVELEL